MATVHREGVVLELPDYVSVADAATVARQKCRAVGDPTWLAYVVYGRPDGRLVRS